MGKMSDLLIELEEVAASVPTGEFKRNYPYADIRIWETVNGPTVNEDDRQRGKYREFAKNKERF
jgi:hypothetical protein